MSISKGNTTLKILYNLMEDEIRVNNLSSKVLSKSLKKQTAKRLKIQEEKLT